MKGIKAIHLILFIINCSLALGETKSYDLEKVKQNDSLEITKSKFDSLIVNSTSLINDSKELTIDNYIEIVRLVNTIEKNNLFDDYKEFRDLYYLKVFKKAVHVLEASIWKGGCFYSEKYDIFIGGKTQRNSQFTIN